MIFNEPEYKNTKLTLQIGDCTCTMEKKGTDPSAEDILQMLYAAMVGQTFLPVTVIDSMRDFAEENTEYTTAKREVECDTDLE